MILNEIDSRTIDREHFDCTIAGAGLVGIYVSLILSRSNIRILNIPGGSLKENVVCQEPNSISVNGYLEDPDFVKAKPRIVGGSGKIWGGRVQEFDAWDIESRDWLATESWPIKWGELIELYGVVAKQLGLYWERERDIELSLNLPNDYRNRSLDIRFGEFWLAEKDFFKRFRSELENSKNFVMLENCNLSQIESKQNWEKANEKVVEIITNSGFSFQAYTKTAILAMGAVENSRMLMNMHIKNGTLNEAREYGLGKNFMIHLLAKFPHISEPIGTDVVKKYKLSGVYSKRIIQLSRKTQESLEIANSHGTFFPPETNLLNPRDLNNTTLRLIRQHGFRFPLEVYSKRNSILKKLTKSEDRAQSRQNDSNRHNVNKAILSLWGEHLPSIGNEIKLSTIRDQNGRFQFDLRVSVSELDAHSMAMSASTIQEILSSTRDVDGSDTYNRNRSIVEESFSNKLPWGHQMGGTKMSRTRFGGVVKKTGETYAFPGVYVCGTSVFPSGSHVAPTFTALALSLLSIRDIEKKIKKV